MRHLQAFGANVLRGRPSADASPFISPRRPAGRAGRRIAGLRKSLAAPVIQQSQQRRAEPPKAFPPHGNSGRSRNVWTSGGIRFAGSALRSCLALVGRGESRNAGANVLGGKIKEEASAAGRRRGTFAPKGLRTRRPGRQSSTAFPPPDLKHVV